MFFTEPNIDLGLFHHIESQPDVRDCLENR